MNNSCKCTTSVLLAIPLLFAFASCSEDTIEPDTTPPTVSLTYPVDGDTVGSQTPLHAAAHDNSGIASVRFYAEDQMIAEDNDEPYDQVWYSGFWEDGREYTIRVETEDESGNATSSEPIVLYVAEASKFVAEMVRPSSDDLITTSEVTYQWRPVPGARGYILRLIIPDVQIDQFVCDEAAHETCYLRLSDTHYAGCLPIDDGSSVEGVIDVIADVKAYWDSYHKSEWSEEVRFKADPPEDLPRDIQDILEGVHMRIRETYMGRHFTYQITEPKVTIQLETIHIYPQHNLYIEYECAVEDDMIRIDLTGIKSPELVQPALGPARSDIFIYPAPGQHTLVIQCHGSEDVFSLQLTDSSIYYEQEVSDFVDSETELLWRIKPNSFFFYGRAYNANDEWMITAFHDSLLAMGCFEEFVYPDGGIPPYECGECDFFYYKSEKDFIAAGDMLGLFMQDPEIRDGSFWILLLSWNNIRYSSYDFQSIP